MNVKQATKGFPKQLLLEKLQDDDGKYVRNRRAYAKIDVDVEGEKHTFFGAAHADRQPMVLVGSTGSSAEAPEVERPRRYWDGKRGEVVGWIGKLQQPMMHYIYRSYFNRVDLFNRYTFGPGSIVTALRTDSFDVRMFITLIAFCVTNAFLAMKAAKGWAKEDMSLGQFKQQLADELSAKVASMRARSSDGASTPRQAAQDPARSSGEFPASRGAWDNTAQAGPFAGHFLHRDKERHPVCEVCGQERTWWRCGDPHPDGVCGRWVCNPATGRTCLYAHMWQVMSNAAPSPARKKSRGPNAKT
jgi:hypothetical protein